MAGDPGRALRTRRPKTLSRWFRVTLAANGLNADTMPFADVRAIADILEATGRTIPRNVWVDHFVAQAEDAALDSLF